MSMSRFERWSVWSTTAGTLVTGVVYWWMKDMMTPVEPWAVINHPLQPWVLKAHILIAPLLVFSVGLITTRHIWQHFRSRVRKARKTGLIAALTLIPLVATGYLIQVVTAETLVRLLGWAHLGLGIVYSLDVAAHWPASRRGADRQVRDVPGTRLASPAFEERARPRYDRRAGSGTR